MGRQLDDGDDNLLDRGRRTVGQELGDMVAVPLVVLLWGGNSLSPDLMNQYIAISLACYIFITQTPIYISFTIVHPNSIIFLLVV